MNSQPINSFSNKGGGRIAPWLRVKRVAGGVEPAGAADNFIGTTIDGDVNHSVSAVQNKSVGIHFATSTGAIAEGDEIQGGAAGAVTKLGAGTAIGVADEAATAAGDVIRVVYY